MSMTPTRADKIRSIAVAYVIYSTSQLMLSKIWRQDVSRITEISLLLKRPWLDSIGRTLTIHVFHALKFRIGFTKVRYRGLEKKCQSPNCCTAAGQSGGGKATYVTDL